MLRRTHTLTQTHTFMNAYNMASSHLLIHTHTHSFLVAVVLYGAHFSAGCWRLQITALQCELRIVRCHLPPGFGKLRRVRLWLLRSLCRLFNNSKVGRGFERFADGRAIRRGLSPYTNRSSDRKPSTGTHDRWCRDRTRNGSPTGKPLRTLTRRSRIKSIEIVS